MFLVRPKPIQTAKEGAGESHATVSLHLPRTGLTHAFFIIYSPPSLCELARPTRCGFETFILLDMKYHIIT
jgi:hypothetical protein